MQLEWDDEPVKKPQSTQDLLAKYRFVLKCAYDEIARHSGDCETCDDLIKIKIYIERMVQEQDIKLHLDKA